MKLSVFSRQAILLLGSLLLFTLLNLFLIKPAFTQSINSWDTRLMLWVNGGQNSLTGTVLYLGGRIWLGLLLFVLPLVSFIRHYGRADVRLGVYTLLLMVVTFLLSDKLVKPLFKGPAPSRQPAFCTKSFEPKRAPAARIALFLPGPRQYSR